MKNVFFLLCFLPFASWSQDQTPWEKQLDSLFTLKLYPEVIEFCEQTIALDSTHLSAWANIPYGYIGMGKNQEAYDAFSEAIFQFPEVVGLRIDRGGFLLELNEHELCLEDYNYVYSKAETKQDSLDALLNIGAAYTSSRQFNEAYLFLKKAHYLDPLDYKILINLSFVFGELKEFEQSENHLLKALEIKPNDEYALNNLGYSYQVTGKYEESLSIFDQLIALDPENPRSYNNRGYTHFLLGNHEQALIDINTGIKLWDQNSYAYRNRALVFIAQGLLDHACADLHKAELLQFSVNWGNEVQELMKTHCSEKDQD